MRTPLTYYGGKQTLAPEIVALMPRHTSYLEPFAGGAAVFFAKPAAERETLNDVDGQIMGFWRALREQPEDLAAAVAATPYGRAEWESSLEPAEDELEAARRLLIRIGQSWAREGKSWSPPSIVKANMGRWQPRTWQDMPERLLVAVQRLTNVCLECRDAVELIPRWDDAGSLIYVDPPYIGPDRKAPHNGYAFDATPDLWPRLVDALLKVEHAAVILSGYPNAEADRLGWRSVQLGTASAPETVWLSPAVPAPQMNLMEAAAA